MGHFQILLSPIIFMLVDIEPPCYTAFSQIKTDIIVFTAAVVTFPIFIIVNHIYQPLRSGRIWHKVNF